MKIGIYDPYLDDLGGGERYMMTIAKCLSQNHEVHVFWNNADDLRNIEKRFALDLSKVKITKNIFSGLSMPDKLKESAKFDAIVFLSDGSIPFLFSKRIFLHIQQPIISAMPTLKDKLKLKRIDFIFCNSKFTKNFVDKAYKVSSKLLYPPVSIYGVSSKKENIILHVGRFRVMNVRNKDYKKQRVMIDAFKEMVDQGLRNWEFVLGVSLPDDKDQSFLDMKNSAKGYPIRFIVNADKDELWQQGSKARIYWHASGYGEDLEKHPEYAEHFGISTVEAMGIGAVPVVINAGGQKEIVSEGENGYLWDSIEDLEKKTLKLINDQSLLEKLSKKAYESSLRFSEENFDNQVNELIK
jgi:glycosyltransferase involved in cell wall biosynthesis